MDRKAYINEISKYGLILFAICAVSMVLSSWLGAKSIIVSFLIWALKFYGCIHILYKACKSYAERLSLNRTSAIFPYGFRISMLSNVAISAYTLLHYSLFFPISEEQINMAMTAYGDIFPAEYMENIELIFENYAELTSMSMLIYLTVFSAIASLIIASATRIKDPFRTPADKKEEDDDII